MNIIRRVTNLVERVLWMKGLKGSYFSSFLFWVRASLDSSCVGMGKYRGTEIVFRGLDTAALKEVLVDMEYAKVIKRLEASEAPVVLDIGAHIGLFSLSVLKDRPRAHVLSVEADPHTYDYLIQNVQALREQGGDWNAMNAAAWGADGEQLCFECSGPSMSHRVSDSGKVMVTAITFRSLIDQLLQNYDVIDLMKVDVEGSEEAFLCASPELLQHVRCMVIELHPGLCNADRVRRALENVYGTIEELHDRTSSKPLLLCY